MNDGTVLTVEYTAREIDLESRAHYRDWEDSGFAADSYALDWLVAVRHEAQEHMPGYVVNGMKARGV